MSTWSPLATFARLPLTASIVIVTARSLPEICALSAAEASAEKLLSVSCEPG